jgi:hypothetical protein
LIFEYLLEHFQLKTAEIFRDGYVVLEPRQEPQPLQRIDLPFDVVASDTSSHLTLRQPTVCSVLEMQLVVVYPVTTILGRPNDIRLTVGLADGTELQTQIVPIEVGEPFRTLVYLGTPGEEYQLFGEGYAPALSSEFRWVAIRPGTNDLLDVDPSHLEVQALSCVE